eukprot:403348336
MERQIIDHSQQDRKTQIIENLLAKPVKKPDFAAFKGSDVLKRAQQFMPMFISTTDRLLSDPELLKQNQMDIKLVENGDQQQREKKNRQMQQDDNTDMKDDQEDEDDQMDEDQIKDPKTICMDIGIGVYDINNENFDEANFQASSTRPIVKFNGLQEADSSSEDEDDSDDSNLYYEFNSDDENMDNASSVTKDTVMSQIIAKKHQSNNIKRPMIIDITGQEEQKQQSGREKLLKKRKRNQ